jgi:tripartite-type tricarboxylate transporter receptor subunit TctC
MLGQHVDSLYSNYPTASGLLKAGKLRALAVGSRTRIEPMPELPTVAESGYPDYEEDVWFGVVAPAGTPKPALTQLAAWFVEAIQAPEIKSKRAAQELYTVGLCGEHFAAHLRKQHENYGRIIREARIKTP